MFYIRVLVLKASFIDTHMIKKTSVRVQIYKYATYGV